MKKRKRKKKLKVIHRATRWVCFVYGAWMRCDRAGGRASKDSIARRTKTGRDVIIISIIPRRTAICMRTITQKASNYFFHGPGHGHACQRAPASGEKDLAFRSVSSGHTHMDAFGGQTPTTNGVPPTTGTIPSEGWPKGRRTDRKRRLNPAFALPSM